MTERAVDSLSTPIGELLVAVDEGGAVVGLTFRGDRRLDEAVRDLARSGEEVVWDPARCEPVTRQLTEYFRRERTTFDLVLKPHGTAFEARVWAALLDIPYGQTTTYGRLAQRLGDPKTVRAVGRANGANPIAILIPCHRVIGADGSLIGYGGGIEVKRALLELEGALLL